jgi:hypothetical protein
MSEHRIEVHDFGEHYADDVSHHTHNAINNTTLPLYHPTSTSPISLESLSNSSSQTIKTRIRDI